MQDIKNMLKIAGVYIGLVIGAGFASGREIVTFFTSYGKWWGVGIVTMGVLLMVMGCLILKIIEDNDISDYSGFLRTVMGKKEAVLTEFISGTFLCVLFFAMVAAGGSLIYESFGMSKWIGSLALSVLCLITFVYGMDAVVKVNAVLSPIMVLGTVIIFLAYCFGDSRTVFLSFSGDKFPETVVFSALIYVSYNIVSAVSVFVEAKDIVRESRAAKFGAVLGGSVLAAMGAMFAFVLLGAGDDILKFDIPMLEVLRSFKIIEFIYVVVFLGAIVTTAVANGFGAVRWIESKVKIKRVKIEIIVCLAAFIMSFFGFSGFTDKIYPIFGFLGMIEIFYILRFVLKKK